MNVSALLSAAADGDRAAWDALVDRFAPLVWATARAHRLADADAADVVQTTWLKLVEHIAQIQQPDRVGAWLATTARRESLRVIAAGGRVSPTDELADVPEPQPGPAESLIRDDRDALLRQGLSKLGDRCRLLLRLMAADPAPSYDDLSVTLDMPVGSIGPTRGRCLERLRGELELLGITRAT